MRVVITALVMTFCAVSTACTQENGAPLPAPAPQAAPRDYPQDRSVSKKEMEGVNVQIVAARKANAEKRYADAEKLMVPLTHENPALVLPWVELGTAQMNLKKYPDAENDFKMALGIEPATQAKEHKDDFYLKRPDEPGVVAPSATRASRNTVGGTVVANAENRSPEVQGIAWASLGEVYAHEGKTGEAEKAFDTAVKVMPTSAAQFRRNETISFFQAGKAEAQLKAANQAIALEPGRAGNYYFKGQALVGQASIDAKTGKMVLPDGCAEAYQKYVGLDPNGPYSADAKGVLAAAGIGTKK